MTRPVTEGDPEVYLHGFEGDDANLLAWEKAKELNAEGERVLVAA